jgi:hypothetical protein
MSCSLSTIEVVQILLFIDWFLTLGLELGSFSIDVV